MICLSSHPVRMEGAMMEMRKLHDKMKMQVEQVLEQHHLQNKKPTQNMLTHNKLERV